MNYLEFIYELEERIKGEYDAQIVNAIIRDAWENREHDWYHRDADDEQKFYVGQNIGWTKVKSDMIIIAGLNAMVRNYGMDANITGLMYIWAAEKLEWYTTFYKVEER
jgi:hypothetical protein